MLFTLFLKLILEYNHLNMSKFYLLLLSTILLPLIGKTQLPEKLQIQWVEIPGGTFTMGSPTIEIGRDTDEVEHEVVISPFMVSKYEITYDQFIFFCKATGYKKPTSEDQEKGNHPIVNVDWNDAVAFSNWIGCRLLTEAEWEYVCRAGTNTPFYYGDKITSDQVNFDGNYPYNQSPKSSSKGKPVPVGSYKPNKWGVHDMHGNVWEWVSDWYAVYNIDDRNNPKGPQDSKLERIGRGGSFYEGGNENRCADRGAQIPTTFGTNIGFRVAKSL